jgi:hypothetical protein
MKRISLEACINALDEMILRHQKLHAHIQKGGDNRDSDVAIEVEEVQALLQICLDTLKRHVPEDSELLNNWHIEKHVETFKGFSIKGAIEDLMKQRGKLKAALSVAKYSLYASKDDV